MKHTGEHEKAYLILQFEREFTYALNIEDFYRFLQDTEKKSINFLTSLIGLKGTFLSNVFKIQKGVGKKLLLDEINLEAQDISTDSLIVLIIF